MIKSYERLKKQNKERIRVPRTVQDTIPVDSVYKDGIFRSGNRYTKSYTVCFWLLIIRLHLVKIKTIYF